MVKILELPSVRQQAKPIDVRTYHWMGENGLACERTELLRGVIIGKTSKSPLHCFVVGTLTDLLSRVTGEGRLVRKEGPLTLSDSEPEPDISIVNGISEDFKLRHPDTAELVIEVAISSVELDREKATIYAEAGVKEYWLILPQTNSIEIFTSPEAGVYQAHRVVASGETAASTVLPDFRINLSELIGN